MRQEQLANDGMPRAEEGHQEDLRKEGKGKRRGQEEEIRGLSQ